MTTEHIIKTERNSIDYPDYVESIKTDSFTQAIIETSKRNAELEAVKQMATPSEQSLNNLRKIKGELFGGNVFAQSVSKARNLADMVALTRRIAGAA